jgi:hypothetical protein
LIDEITMTATNYGLIAAQDLTYYWDLEYWEDVRFVLPDEGVYPNRTRNLGVLPANSSVEFPVKVEQLVRFEVPKNMTELRVGNNVFFLPLPDDPTWETGIGMIVAPEDDPINGQVYVQLDLDGRVVFTFDFATSTLFEVIYNDGNSTEVMSTYNATFPRRRLTGTSFGKPVPLKSKSSNVVQSSHGRRLQSCGDFGERGEELEEDCETCELIRDLICVILAGGTFGKHLR